MERRDNYRLQSQQAKARFLTYDQDALIHKLSLMSDNTYLYPILLQQPYRLCRTTGDLQKQTSSGWTDANTHAEVMTMLDLICDSREDRFPSHRWQNMLSFGLQFHQNLMEDGPDPFAEAIQSDPEAFRRACLVLQGEAAPGGDIAYAFRFFEGLRIALQFWEGDEEFAPRVRFLWDANALMYLKYETMWYAVGLLKTRLLEEIKTA